MGAASIRLADENPRPILGIRLAEFGWSPSTSYGTGGETVYADKLCLKQINQVIGGMMFSNTKTYIAVPIFDATGARTFIKFVILVFATMAEVASTTDLHTENFRGAVLGL